MKSVANMYFTKLDNVSLWLNKLSVNPHRFHKNKSLFLGSFKAVHYTPFTPPPLSKMLWRIHMDEVSNFYFKLSNTIAHKQCHLDITGHWIKSFKICCIVCFHGLKWPMITYLKMSKMNPITNNCRHVPVLIGFPNISMNTFINLSRLDFVWINFVSYLI